MQGKSICTLKYQMTRNPQCSVILQQQMFSNLATAESFISTRVEAESTAKRTAMATNWGHGRYGPPDRITRFDDAVQHPARQSAWHTDDQFTFAEKVNEPRTDTSPSSSELP